MAETEEITVADVSDGPGTDGQSGAPVDLPVVELLTGRGFITGKSGSGKSILGGTPVYTEDGRKPIERVEEGERVLSLNRYTYEQEFREVQATIEHTGERLLRITLEDGTELVGTADHSFLTVDDLEIVPVRGDQVEEGTWMPTARELPSPGSVTEVDLTEYLGGANNVVVDGGVIRSGPRVEDRTLDLEFGTGKEIGLYLAEGSFDGGMTIQISNVADGVREFLDSRGYNVSERTCNKGFQPYARFLDAEFGRGSGEKSLPGWVFDAPAPFRAGLLSGYFDGDGTVTEEEVTAISKSESLIAGIKELLAQFGVSATVREKYTLYEGDRRRYRRLRVDARCIERFADTVDLSVERKARRLADYCEALDDGERYDSKDMIPEFGSVLNAAARTAAWTERDSERRADGQSVHHLTRKQKAGRRTYNRLVEELDVGGRAKAFGVSDIHWQRVVSVEEVDGQRAVYDLDVEHNDNFIADGVFVHNSNSASVVAEKLLDSGFGLFIVDIDGEYYGLKEEYEILHVGADEECDIQVGEDHAEKLASLALEQNVPIILDVSSFLDESEAEAVLTAVARHLFAKAKKQKQPFLLLVEEVHEYIPEGGSVGECGKMLIKIGKRGRKHGLGVVGISQRPADVKKDFITQCDWLLWHRLTWDNDTNVVRRVLDGEYATAVEDLDDGEGFLVTDWSESVRRVQFHRKQTFDAGATPGLDDVERPDLKSVSTDLVAELAEISEAAQARESRVEELREELDRKNSRVAELEAELRDARDLSRMADQFVGALLDQVDGAAPGRTEQERMRERRARRGADSGSEREGDEDTVEATTGGRGDSGDALGDGETGEAPVAAAASVTEAGASRTHDAGGASTPGAGSNGAAPPSVGGDTAADAGGARRLSAEATLEALRDPVGEMASGGGSDSFAVTAAAGCAGEADGEEPLLVRELKAEVGGLDTRTRGMLAYYTESGPGTPLDAHLAAGGDGDRTHAYAHNRRLRTCGLVEHVGRGAYDDRLRDLLREGLDGATADELEAYAREVEETVLG